MVGRFRWSGAELYDERGERRRETGKREEKGGKAQGVETFGEHGKGGERGWGNRRRGKGGGICVVYTLRKPLCVCVSVAISVPRLWPCPPVSDSPS